MTPSEPAVDGADSEESPVRVCRRCSVQSTQPGDFCPNCGSPFSRGRKLTRRRLFISAVVVALVAGGVGGGLLLQHRHDTAMRQDLKAAAQAAADAHAQAEQEAVKAERDRRSEIVESLEERITEDAKGHVKDGLLDGPILYTQCTATGGGSTDDLTALTGTFECLAARKENKDGTVSGYAYQGTADWAEGSISWHLGR